MSRKSYSEINLHITWHVKDDIPVLKDDLEGHVLKDLRRQVVTDSGAFLHEVGGTDDHGDRGRQHVGRHSAGEPVEQGVQFVKQRGLHG